MHEPQTEIRWMVSDRAVPEIGSMDDMAWMNLSNNNSCLCAIFTVLSLENMKVLSRGPQVLPRNNYNK